MAQTDPQALWTLAALGLSPVGTQAKAKRAGTLMTTNPDWWRDALIYHIYPRSFADSNGDGVGDLPGITHRLGHVAALGFDAVWISPIFPSPMADFGYDVADYCTIDPLFGTLGDFDALMAEANRLGLKVILDWVLSHTSEAHPWFAQSRLNRTNPRADWYVWADAKPDGTPPNNWLSIFGGSAWQWDTRRQQYYLHNFLVQQPDLNWLNGEVVEAMLDGLRFWLERGVAGVRLDAVGYLHHDPALADNPVRDATAPAIEGLDPANPFTRQWCRQNFAREGTFAAMEPVRTVLDAYGAISIAEIGIERSLEQLAAFSRGEDRLHMGYHFGLLDCPFEATALAALLDREAAALGWGQGRSNGGWPCRALGNHDVRRFISRSGCSPHHGGTVAVLGAVLLSALRGALCWYQGDELGLAQAVLAYEDLKDPVGLTFWPEDPGRDGCRTPLPWKAADGVGAGFTDGDRPWLPIPPDHRAHAVDQQEGVPGSILEQVRAVFGWRRQDPRLGWQASQRVWAEGPVLVIVRQLVHGPALMIRLNLSDRPWDGLPAWGWDAEDCVPLVASARGLAALSHSGQTDKVGVPYLAHVADVARRVRGQGPEAEAVAWLHDTVEDCGVSLDQIEAACGSAVRAGVAAMTRQEGEDYATDYLPRLMANPHARVVKAADAAHNRGKVALLQRHDAAKAAQLAAKYDHALLCLSGAVPAVIPIAYRQGRWHE